MENSNHAFGLSYFKAFSNRDIESITKLVSEDINLRDWDIEANGIDEFIKATNNIFTAFSQISIKILHIHQTEHVLIFELKIILDNTITLLVVDILEFTKDHKIKVIRAYKGNN